MLSRLLLCLALLASALPCSAFAQKKLRIPFRPTGELANNCEDLLVEKLFREGRFQNIASARHHNSNSSFWPNLLWADRPLTVARGLEKTALLMERAGTRYALVGPRPATNLPGVELPEFDPSRPADSLHFQLRSLFRITEPYTLLIDLTGDGKSKVIANSANRRFWKRVVTITKRFSPVSPAYTIVGATTSQVPINHRALADGAPREFLALPRFVLHRLF